MSVIRVTSSIIFAADVYSLNYYLLSIAAQKWFLVIEPYIILHFKMSKLFSLYFLSIWFIPRREFQFTSAAAAAKSIQSCLTLCDPIGGSPPGSLVPGILQARTLEWAAISFSHAGKWKVKGKSLSRVRLLATSWTAAYQASPSMGFSMGRPKPAVSQLITRS